LQQQCPDRSFVVLDALGACGGTWRTHRYPGIRSDSDLYTFGYRFKPWTGRPIAEGDAILSYLDEVIAENNLSPHIRYRHRVLQADWDSGRALWTVRATGPDTGASATFTCNFLWMCQGYYRHEAGYTPDWPGMAQYKGRIVHPQTWPEDLDYAGKAHPADRVRRHSGDAVAGHRRRLRPRHPAAAVADLLRTGSQRERPGRPTERP
jgi:cation diffusion facilitator CzcD-associated flavoprotein CzcO